MAILLKTMSVRVSSIQIVQVRVQNKVKSVWKSRYIGDVSMYHTHQLTRYFCFPRLFFIVHDTMMLLKIDMFELLKNI